MLEAYREFVINPIAISPSPASLNLLDAISAACRDRCPDSP